MIIFMKLANLKSQIYFVIHHDEGSQYNMDNQLSKVPINFIVFSKG
jgi:hypothetical protein